MTNYKRMMCLLIVGLLCISLSIVTVSAFEFDNKKYYDEETETITFKNSFLGLIPLDTFAVAQLKTPKVNPVIFGKDRRVMIWDVELYLDEYDNFIKAMEIYDFNQGEYVNEGYKWQVAVYGDVRAYDYPEVCTDNNIPSKNGSKAEGQTCTGTRNFVGYERGIVGWSDLTEIKLTKGNHTIALVKDVAPGEHQDGIPTLFGKRIDEWAEWTDSFNVGLVTYYDFEEGDHDPITHGLLLDKSEGKPYNHENTDNSNGNITQGFSGIINRSYKFKNLNANDNAYTRNLTTITEFSSFNDAGFNITVNIWANTTVASNTINTFHSLGESSASVTEFIVMRSRSSLGGAVQFLGIDSVNTFNVDEAAASATRDGKFHMYTYVLNTTGFHVYKNGTFLGVAGTGIDYPLTGQDQFCHAMSCITGTHNNGFNDSIDESAMWNRSLSLQEIQDLYNGGDGISKTFNSTVAGVDSALNVTLELPVNGTLTSNPVFFFNATLHPVELNLTNATITVWYVNSTVFNVSTNIVLNNETNTTSWDMSSIPEGIFLWNVEGCGDNSSSSICNISENNRTFEVDLTPFSIILTSPTGIINQAEAGGNLTVNWTITDPNTDTCNFEYNGVNTTVVCADGNYSFELVSGQQSIIFTGNDTAGNVAFNTTSWIYTIFTNNISLNATTLDTAFESFIINVTYDSSLWTSILTSLIYNGTSFTTTKSGSGDEVRFLRGLDIPIVEDRFNHTFNWQITLSNSTDTDVIDTTEHIQEVEATNMSLCGNPLDESGVNFSVFDENDPDIAINVSTFDNSLNWFLGTGSVKKNISFENNDVFNVELCISHNETFHTESRIQLVEPGFANRLYELIFLDVTNVTTQFQLFMLNESSASNIIIEVKDAGLVPFEGVTTEIRRFYPVDNIYRLVETQITDHFGQFVASLVQNDVRYRFRFIGPDGVQLKETGDVVIACRSTICVIPFVIEDTTNDFERFQNVTGFDWTLSFDNGTNTFLYSWTDTTGETHVKRLLVERKEFNASTIVCNKTSSADSGSLNCAVGNADAQYTAQIFRDSQHRRLSVLNVFVGSSYKDFGLEGLIWTFFLTMTMIAVGVFWPPAGIALYLLGIFVLGVGNIIFINTALIIAQIVIGVLFIWALRV